jgi:formylglycine-generating enzyme required for sulfatase activity
LDGAPAVPGTWVLIDVSGTPFTMGAHEAELGRDSDEIAHDVTLTLDFWMMTTEITQQQFQDVMGYNPSAFTACGVDCPVERVNWHEMAAYSNELSRQENLEKCYECAGTAPATINCLPSGSYGTPYECPGYRLPTEAEWEYAARGGTTTSTHNGDVDPQDCLRSMPVLDEIAWYDCNSDDAPHRVGTKTANAFGVYDMLGNVNEWCHDWYGTHPDVPQTDPAGPPSGSTRVLHGGAWDRYAGYNRAANRYSLPPATRDYTIGGRISRSKL